MKRDMDLIRTILIEIEDHENPRAEVPIKAPGYSPDQITYHLGLLYEAGLINALHASHLSGERWIPQSLTWQGHEFLDAARNDTVWQKLKAEIKDHSASLPFQLIQAMLIKITAHHFGLPS